MQVIATAGHVDHGKSTLVRALTGMEPDRWAEERRRGLTIDLGLRLDELPGRASGIAFVDVPGHERFVPNMLAGLGPVPAVLFVVAADGGWMPQSAEHLAAIDALGISHGLLVVTRADLADPGPALRRAARRDRRHQPGRGGGGRGQRGDRRRAARAARRAGPAGRAAAGPDPARPVRLWVDRAFSISGSGTVVTGTLPGRDRARPAMSCCSRRRCGRCGCAGIESLEQPAEQVRGVARVALNLRGVAAGAPGPGDGAGRARRVDADRRTSTSGGRPSGPLARLAAPGGGPARRLGPRRPAGSGSRARRRVAATAGRRRMTAAGPASAGRLADRPADPGASRCPCTSGTGCCCATPAAARPVHRSGATVLDVAPPRLRGRGAAAAAAARPGPLAADPPRARDLLRRHGLLRAARAGRDGGHGAPDAGGRGLAGRPGVLGRRSRTGWPSWSPSTRAATRWPSGCRWKRPGARCGCPTAAWSRPWPARAGRRCPSTTATLTVAPGDGRGRAGTGTAADRGAPDPGRDLAGDPFRAPEAARLRELGPGHQGDRGGGPGWSAAADQRPGGAGPGCRRRAARCWPGCRSRSPPPRPGRRSAPPGGWPSRCWSTWTGPGSPSGCPMTGAASARCRWPV